MGKSAPRGKELYRDVTRFFLETPRNGWMPQGISFGHRKILSAYDSKWEVSCDIGIQFNRLQATVWVHPKVNSRGASDRKCFWKSRLRVCRYFDDIARRMQRLGYIGDWELRKLMRFADVMAYFRKELKSFDDVTREYRVLNEIDLSKT